METTKTTKMTHSSGQCLDDIKDFWESVKKRIRIMDIRDLDSRVAQLAGGRSIEGVHYKNKTILHNIKIETKVLEAGTGYDLEYQWAYCPACRQIRYKKLIAWNHLLSECFERFVYKLDSNFK